jgi:hypothetical protein
MMMTRKKVGQYSKPEKNQEFKNWWFGEELTGPKGSRTNGLVAAKMQQEEDINEANKQGGIKIISSAAPERIESAPYDEVSTYPCCLLEKNIGALPTKVIIPVTDLLVILPCA